MSGSRPEVGGVSAKVERRSEHYTPKEEITKGERSDEERTVKKNNIPEWQVQQDRDEGTEARLK